MEAVKAETTEGYCPVSAHQSLLYFYLPRDPEFQVDIAPKSQNRLLVVEIFFVCPTQT